MKNFFRDYECGDCSGNLEMELDKYYRLIQHLEYKKAKKFAEDWFHSEWKDFTDSLKWKYKSES
ncbi:MAG: hypothetical protein V1648_02385 [Candidatus Aenigmatarchaeota archaeon]